MHTSTCNTRNTNQLFATPNTAPKPVVCNLQYRPVHTNTCQKHVQNMPTYQYWALAGHWFLAHHVSIELVLTCIAAYVFVCIGDFNAEEYIPKRANTS